MFESAVETLGSLNWGTVPEWVLAGAAALAAIQGWRSLSAWRREAGGRRRLELAEEILTRVYEVSDAVLSVRNPHGHIDENQDRPGREKEDARLREYRDMYYPIIRRLREAQPMFAALTAQGARTRALFGSDLQASFNEVIEIHNEVAEAASELFYDLPWEGKQTKERLARHLELRSKLWRSDDGDPIEPKLSRAIVAVEVRLRPIIKKAVA